MNVRERFLTVMEGGAAASPKWEFGYWGANYANWYREGLPKHRQPHPLTKTSTTNSSLYIPCWNSLPPGRLSAGHGGARRRPVLAHAGIRAGRRRARRVRDGQGPDPGQPRPALSSAFRAARPVRRRNLPRVRGPRRCEAAVLQGDGRHPQRAGEPHPGLGQLEPPEGGAAVGEGREGQVPLELGVTAFELQESGLPAGARRLPPGLLRNPRPPHGLRAPLLQLHRRSEAHPRHPGNLHRGLDCRLRGSARADGRGHVRLLGGHLRRDRLHGGPRHDPRIHAAVLQAAHRFPQGPRREGHLRGHRRGMYRPYSRCSWKAASPACIQWRQAAAWTS